MNDLFNKLILMKRLKFEPGFISLLDQRVCLQSIKVMSAITKLIDSNPSFVSGLYSEIKKAHINGWGGEIRALYKMQPREYMNFMFEIANLAGWGVSSLTDFDPIKIEGKFIIKNSPVGGELKGQVRYPAEHIWRAMGAGTGTAIFNKDMDWIETKCIALGDPFCEVFFGLRENLPVEIKEKYKYQLDI